jgi:hypothetical protein
MGKEIFESKGLQGKDALVDEVKTKAGELWDLIPGTNEPGTEGGRYYALAKTHLEDAIMWFVKGVSRSVA